jgi:hypothetical protein
MLAGKALLGCFSAFVNVAAVGEMLLHHRFLFEYFTGGYIGGRLAILPLVKLFYFGDFLE